MGKKRVLFLCVHNSARSQMAEGFLRALYGDRFEAHSAGSDPKGVSPYAVKVMAEVGIDISSHRSKHVSEFEGQEFDVAVTLCEEAERACPFFPAKKQLHRAFPDPEAVEGTEEEKLAAFRRVRDEIRAWIEETFGKGGDV